jgi:hypothetical protein
MASEYSKCMMSGSTHGVTHQQAEAMENSVESISATAKSIVVGTTQETAHECGVEVKMGNGIGVVWQVQVNILDSAARNDFKVRLCQYCATATTTPPNATPGAGVCGAGTAPTATSSITTTVKPTESNFQWNCNKPTCEVRCQDLSNMTSTRFVDPAVCLRDHGAFPTDLCLRMYSSCKDRRLAACDAGLGVGGPAPLDPPGPPGPSGPSPGPPRTTPDGVAPDGGTEPVTDGTDPATAFSLAALFLSMLLTV